MGVFKLPPVLQSIDLAIEDLKKTESYIYADDNIRSIIINDTTKWDLLQSAIIASIKKIINNTADSKTAHVLCANRFATEKEVIISHFANQFDDIQLQGQPKLAVSATAYILGATYCRRLQAALGNTTGPLDIKKVISDINDATDDNPIAPTDVLAKQAIYYIAGWLLHACTKRAKRSKKGCALYRLLPELVAGSITNDEAERATLPTQLVQEIEKRDAMKYSNSNFF